MFQDDLEARIHGDRQGKFVNDSIINNFETQSQYFKQSCVSGQNDLQFIRGDDPGNVQSMNQTSISMTVKSELQKGDIMSPGTGSDELRLQVP